MLYNFIALIAIIISLLFCLVLWFVFPLIASILYALMGIFLAYCFFTAPTIDDEENWE